MRLLLMFLMCLRKCRRERAVQSSVWKTQLVLKSTKIGTITLVREMLRIMALCLAILQPTPVYHVNEPDFTQTTRDLLIAEYLRFCFYTIDPF